MTDRHCDYEHPMFVDASLRLTAPIPIARQMFTHRMFATNEISRRYVSSEPEFYTPQVWRAKPDGSIKQGSGDGVVDVLYNDAGESFTVAELYVGLNEIATAMYRELVRNKVAPEQARFVLPQSMMTQVIFTGSLHDWAKVYHLRTSSHAQAEIRELTHLVDAQLTAQFGDLWTIAKEATQ
ncbi:MAG: FAD-dependent thymidylate synthase [Halothiobacillus sp.]|nr:FAD-dependent thymidylate synthase [Halothiobacillus sp.]